MAATLLRRAPPSRALARGLLAIAGLLQFYVLPAALGLCLFGTSACWDFKACTADECPDSALDSVDYTGQPTTMTRCDAPGALSHSDCSAGGCAAELSLDCACLEGATLDPRALVIGVIAPETFSSAAGESLRIPFASRWLASLRLALDEWNAALPGGHLPRTRRPLALLRCNSNDLESRAKRAMSHLIERVQAPIVITGADNDTLAVRYRALAGGTPLVCSMCYSAPPEDAEAALGTWPIAPPLVDQAPLAAWRAAELARAARGALPSGQALPTVVSLSQDYPGINEFTAEVQRLLEVSGGVQQVNIQTPDPREQEVVQARVSQAVVDARPQVVVVGMDSDLTTYYLRQIERGWPAGSARPAYVLSYLNQELGLLREIVADNEDLRRRISGVGWQPDVRVGNNLRGLAERFERRHQERLDQTQFGYDAFYTAAYALAWADARLDLDAPAVAQALDHLSAGAPVDTGPAPIADALTRLLAGEDIDLTGSTSRLDWQATNHATQSDVSVWCLGRQPDGELFLVESAGPVWHSASAEITGSYSCP